MILFPALSIPLTAAKSSLVTSGVVTFHTITMGVDTIATCFVNKTPLKMQASLLYKTTASTPRIKYGASHPLITRLNFKLSQFAACLKL